MTDITDFIAELIRAANIVDRVGDCEKTRLLERAYLQIREGRFRVGMPLTKTKTDTTLRLMDMARTIERYSDTEVKAALLDAADIIRTIKIMLDAKDEVLNEGKEP